MRTCNNNYLIHSETCIRNFLRDQGNEQQKWQNISCGKTFKCVKNITTQRENYTFSKSQIHSPSNIYLVHIARWMSFIGYWQIKIYCNTRVQIPFFWSNTLPDNYLVQTLSFRQNSADITFNILLNMLTDAVQVKGVT
jgi:hypothetical protein